MKRRVLPYFMTVYSTFLHPVVKYGYICIYDAFSTKTALNFIYFMAIYFLPYFVTVDITGLEGSENNSKCLPRRISDNLNCSANTATMF